MGNQLARSISSLELAHALSLVHVGPEAKIGQVCGLSERKECSLVFSKCSDLNEALPGGAIICPYDSIYKEDMSIIQSNNPRFDFARALAYLSENIGFKSNVLERSIHPTAIVHPSAHIANNVRIGSNTIVEAGAIIHGETILGSDCIVGANSVIGRRGFGYERDKEGKPFRIEHLGGTFIADNVELGAFNSVCRATLESTIISSHVKTDDHVHIAHNCQIGRSTLICASAVLSGGVTVGERVWIGPNATVIQKVSLGNDCFIGICANVTKDVASCLSVAGNPARALKAK